MDLWRAIKAIRNRKGLFALIFLVTLVAVILIPRGNVEIIYESKSKILLTPPTSNVGSGRRGQGQAQLWFADELTLRELVTSQKLLRRVATQLGTPDAWEDLREQVEYHNPDDSYRGYYGKQITLFYLVASDTDPQTAQELASALLENFVSYVQDLSAREFANTRRYLEELVAEAREKVDEAEEQLLSIAADKSRGDGEKLMENEAELEKDRLKLKDEIAQLESEASTLSNFLSGSSSIPPWSIISKKDQMLSDLETAVSKERLALLELRQTFADKSSRVADQQVKLEKVEKLYEKQLHSVVASLQDERNGALREKRTQLGRVSQQLLNLRKRRLTPEEKRQIASLERQVNMWEENHLNLVKQLYQARVVEQSARRQGAIQVLEKPGLGMVPTNARLPSTVKSVVVGIPFSLIVAVGIVLGAEFWKSSLAFIPQIEDVLELPVLVSIPEVPQDLAEEWEQVKRDTVRAKHLTTESEAEEVTSLTG